MYLTIKSNLVLTQDKKAVLEDYSIIYHKELERLIQIYQQSGGIKFIGYREISNKIAFHSKEQLIHLAQTFYEIRKKHPGATYQRLFVLSKLSFKIINDEIQLEFGKGFLLRPIHCNLNLTDYQKEQLSHNEILRMDVKKEKQHYISRFLVKIKTEQNKIVIHENVMGIDLGMKCPAVCYTNQHKVKFVGNGRQLKYEIRRLNKNYQKLQRRGNQKKLERYAHKLHNYKAYIDHCISKEIVEFAKQQEITLIRLEKLVNLQQKFYQHDQVCWSYQRLTNFIVYKAEMSGIIVEFVDPFLTTKRCPNCGKINNIKGRDYQCSCGFRKHRDLVGAMNILHAPKVE